MVTSAPALGLHRPRHLARILGVTEECLIAIIESRDAYIREYVLLDPAKPGKQRIVFGVDGMLRAVQKTFYRRVLIPALSPSPHSHGGVRNRSIKTNAMTHVDSMFVLSCDIDNFYPSIHNRQVYRFFTEVLNLPAEVSRLCTQLTTYRHHLALGLVTSPFIADQILKPVDDRLATACSSAGLCFSRFVDDISISGPFNCDPNTCGLARTIASILQCHGFKLNRRKLEFGRLADGTPITKLRVRNGRVDVQASYIDKLMHQLDDARSLAEGGSFVGPYYLRDQIASRIRFVCWVNPRRRAALMRSFHSVPWSRVRSEALRRGLVVAKKRLVPVERSQL